MSIFSRHVFGGHIAIVILRLFLKKTSQFEKTSTHQNVSICASVRIITVVYCNASVMDKILLFIMIQNNR